MSDPSDWAQFFAAITGDFDDEDLVAAASAQPWGFPDPALPDWRYSNAGYVALGMMLEEETGTDVGQLLERRVFRPAGMTQSRFETSSKINGPFLVGGSYTSTGYFTERGFNPELFSSAGAVSAPTKDLNRFTRALLSGRLLDPALVAQMTTPGDNSAGFGLGTYRIPDPCGPQGSSWLVGHDGGSYGTTSMMFTSLDGTRQISLGMTGRYYSDSADQTQPHDMVAALQQLAATTC